MVTIFSVFVTGTAVTSSLDEKPRRSYFDDMP